MPGRRKTAWRPADIQSASPAVVIDEPVPASVAIEGKSAKPSQPKPVRSRLGRLKSRTERRDAIDRHVGARMKLRRTLIGMTQEQLGEALGLTFQQIQKYEKGANRISASMLIDVANALDVPVTFFYDDLPADLGVDMTHPDEPVLKREALELVRAFNCIRHPDVRKRAYNLVKVLAGQHNEG